MQYDFDTDLLSLLPPWYAEILDYQQICQTETAELVQAATAIQTISDNFFVSEMDATTVSAWEKVLHIVPNPSVETLSFRRLRVQNRLSNVPPFSLPFLRGKLDGLLGVGNYTLSVDYPNYTLYIDMVAENAQFASEIAIMLETMKPAHIVYRIRPQLFASIALGESIGRQNYVFNYALGAWGLGLKPFASLDERSEIVMAGSGTVQDYLLDGITQDTATKISKARINETIDITTLTKNVSDNVLTVSYTVSNTQAQNVTNVALLDSSNNTLTSAAVYIPVETEVVLTHTIKIEEVGQNGE